VQGHSHAGIAGSLAAASRLAVTTTTMSNLESTLLLGLSDNVC
jgi:hypothetical protein